MTVTDAEREADLTIAEEAIRNDHRRRSDGPFVLVVVDPSLSWDSNYRLGAVYGPYEDEADAEAAALVLLVALNESGSIEGVPPVEVHVRPLLPPPT